MPENVPRRRAARLRTPLFALAVLLFAGLSAQAASPVLERVQSISPDEFIVFGPEEYEFAVIVFTDVNCPNCRALHSALEDYKTWGIQIRYAAFPVIGNAREQMETVWCSDDRAAALTAAKRGEAIEAPACANPVGDHLAIATELRFRGTPTLVTPAGRAIAGAPEAAILLDLLEAEAAPHPDGATQSKH
jgi:thiol:disulfide interchange protein DsbC